MSNFLISEEDWDLNQKGEQDQRRHAEKVKEAIKNNLPDLISSENIVLSDGKKMTRIPIRSLDEYKLRYNFDKTKHVGQGDGKSKVGDVIAKAPGKQQAQQGAGKGKGAGDRPGIDYYEANVSIMEIENLFFKELELPHLKRKLEADITVNSLDYRDIRRKGLMGNIDKRRTILSAIKRNARSGKAQIHPIHEEDLRFKTWETIVKPESRAVVLALMDTSGSMGVWEKYIARSFFFWMNRFLRTKYEKVTIQFIAHHTEATVVSEEDFFTKGESGGTICSSAYIKALELIHSSYPPSKYNIYPFHFSDGDNLSSDNPKCTRLVNEIMDITDFFGYGEINPYHRSSTLMSAYRSIKNEAFHSFILKQKSDVYHAMKYFFQKDPEGEVI
ncbi:sporulation protein YhbH [Sporolactobacillus shoreicorticis]|uniref:Sporulation protein YhbH n=1 Tax=Sporolactobacillus shoreicorticis TaxID=1923877 RepID=A0ABW5S6M9_9BACL|nr:sporulation protein YhbH [Sporolactobacillus shoreicorticis]MCO7128075.1 sporulation protein YhbH [Sporolactobacillus shoreicorticis]